MCHIPSQPLNKQLVGGNPICFHLAAICFHGYLQGVPLNSELHVSPCLHVGKIVYQICTRGRCYCSTPLHHSKIYVDARLRPLHCKWNALAIYLPYHPMGYIQAQKGYPNGTRCFRGLGRIQPVVDNSGKFRILLKAAP